MSLPFTPVPNSTQFLVEWKAPMVSTACCFLGQDGAQVDNETIEKKPKQ